jgi:hypothetical protein
MQNETLKNNLILIKNNLTKLEIKNMSLNNSKIVESVIEKLKLVSGPIGRVVKKKIHAVTEKKFQAILILKQTINDIMSGRHPSKIWNYRLLIVCA